MANKATFDMSGFPELKRVFGQLPVAVADKVTSAAVRASALPIRKAIQANVAASATDSGALGRSITTKVKRFGMNAVAIIGAANKWLPAPAGRKTKSGRINPALYSHLTEGGTKKGVKPVFHTKRAFDSQLAASKERFMQFFAKGIEREARKLGFGRNQK